jgi:hypothetical protein
MVFGTTAWMNGHRLLPEFPEKHQRKSETGGIERTGLNVSGASIGNLNTE